MKSYEDILAEVIRIEYNNQTGDLFLVFKVLNEKLKKQIKENWTKDIEFKLIDKTLVTKE